VSKTFLITENVPANSNELAAMIDRSRPNRFTITWPAQDNLDTRALQDKAQTRSNRGRVRRHHAVSIVCGCRVVQAAAIPTAELRERPCLWPI
jgi:hypothetical protein